MGVIFSLSLRDSGKYFQPQNTFVPGTYTKITHLMFWKGNRIHLPWIIGGLQLIENELVDNVNEWCRHSFAEKRARDRDNDAEWPQEWVNSLYTPRDRALPARDESKEGEDDQRVRGASDIASKPCQRAGSRVRENGWIGNKRSQGLIPTSDLNNHHLFSLLPLSLLRTSVDCFCFEFIFYYFRGNFITTSSSHSRTMTWAPGQKERLAAEIANWRDENATKWALFFKFPMNLIPYKSLWILSKSPSTKL